MLGGALRHSHDTFLVAFEYAIECIGALIHLIYQPACGAREKKRAELCEAEDFRPNTCIPMQQVSVGVNHGNAPVEARGEEALTLRVCVCVCACATVSVCTQM